MYDDSDGRSFELKLLVASGRLRHVIVLPLCGIHLVVGQFYYGGGEIDIKALEDTSHHPSGLSKKEDKKNGRKKVTFLA